MRSENWSKLLVGVAAAAVAGCQSARTEPAATYVAAVPVEEVAALAPVPAEPVERQVPYAGPIGPADPPMPPLPPMQKPLEPWVVAALDTWYERPSPKGPAPIAIAQPKAIYVEGRDPVIQALPGPPAFPDKIPKRLQTVYPKKVPFTNNVKRVAGGTIKLAAVDNTANDTKISDDWMAMEASFTDVNGDEWTIEQVTLAPISPNPIMEPWYGGLKIDTLYHGHTGNGTPAEPLVNCALCSWGWADIYKNGKRVASSALLHVMVTSDTRNDNKNFEYYGYDSTDKPIREIHIIVPPSAYLPSPRGFLHVMWENAQITRGTPQQVKARGRALERDIPTIELSAVPYLQWDKKEIHVQAGRKYRLIVHNNDPVSFHQFHLHAHPAGEGHHHEGMRHNETMTAGRIGPLWKPGDEHHHGGHGEPPAPANVFFPLPQGSTWATMVTFDKPGEYHFACPVANHYRRGMEGKFIVSAAAQGGSQ